MTEADRLVFCDPQTSGGLLICVAEGERQVFEATAGEQGLALQPIGHLEQAGGSGHAWVSVVD